METLFAMLGKQCLINQRSYGRRGGMQHKYSYMLGERIWHFRNLADLMAKATPARSGDRLAGVIAE